MGDDAAFGLLRVLGAAMARLAEAEATVVRARHSPIIQMSHTQDELTHRAGVPRRRGVRPTHRAIDRRCSPPSHDQRPNPLRGRHPRHVGERRLRRRFRGSVGLHRSDAAAHPAELSSLLLNEFNATVTDVVHADGGRVVKFIGDEVMWVSSTPEQLAKAAVDLVEHPRAREAGLQVRAGLGYGRVLAIGGDYFGNRGQPRSPPGRRRGARSDPCRGRPSATSCPTGPPSPQDPLMLKGFDDSGDGLRPAPRPLTARLNAREPRKSPVIRPPPSPSPRHCPNARSDSAVLIVPVVSGQDEDATRDRRRQSVPRRGGRRRDRGRARGARRQGRRRPAHPGGRTVAPGGQRACCRAGQGPRRVARRRDPPRGGGGRALAQRHRDSDHHAVGPRPRARRSRG